MPRTYDDANDDDDEETATVDDNNIVNVVNNRNRNSIGNVIILGEVVVATAAVVAIFEKNPCLSAKLLCAVAPLMEMRWRWNAITVQYQSRCLADYIVSYIFKFLNLSFSTHESEWVNKSSRAKKRQQELTDWLARTIVKIIIMPIKHIYSIMEHRVSSLKIIHFKTNLLPLMIDYLLIHLT